ncbi:MAG: S-layer family protein, partial [Rivularia sp. (in: cyanobacteria)]
RVTLNNRAKLFAESASGNGGNINLQLGELLLLRNGSQISTTAGTAQAGGDGGNIDINSPFIVALPNENSDITANAFTGRGGNIDIITQGIFGIKPRSQASDFTSDITASSETGIQGEISVTDPEIDPSQGLIELPSGVVDKSDQMAQICPRGINAKKLSEFYITGRGNLPPSPLNPLDGTVDLSRLATLDGEMGRLADEEVGRLEDGRSKEIVEAQGFLKTENGEIYLVAQAPTATPSSHANTSVCRSHQ